MGCLDSRVVSQTTRHIGMQWREFVTRGWQLDLTWKDILGIVLFIFILMRFYYLCIIKLWLLGDPENFIGFFKKKWDNPGLFFVFFGLFKQTIQFYNKNICEKCPSSIRCRDLNPQSLEHESLPITTRPGLQNSLLQLRYFQDIFCLK